MDIRCLLPHQIESFSGGDIIEVSTYDDINDSYRIEEGSTQIKYNNKYKDMTYKETIPEIVGDIDE